MTIAAFGDFTEAMTICRHKFFEFQVPRPRSEPLLNGGWLAMWLSKGREWQALDLARRASPPAWETAIIITAPRRRRFWLCGSFSERV